jgi:hypothetical protein
VEPRTRQNEGRDENFRGSASPIARTRTPDIVARKCEGAALCRQFTFQAVKKKDEAGAAEN